MFKTASKCSQHIARIAPRELPFEKLEAAFTADSRLEITPTDIGRTSVVMEGIVGAGVTITPQVLERLRPSGISFNLAKHLLYTHFRDDEGYLVTRGVPIGAILYQDQLARSPRPGATPRLWRRAGGRWRHLSP